MDFDGFKRFKMDDNLEAGEGVRVEYEEGKVITMRRAGGSNTAYNQVLAERCKPHLTALRNGTLSAEDDNLLMAQVYADTVIVGWDGITSDGKAVPFTKENVVALLLAMPDLFTAIKRDASLALMFEAAAKDAIVKN
ncbi:MAG: hypothetical protein P1U50_01120 [Parvibaculaceae bacterium]|nr:hypothetical protein [Parvibaculaceae bacterium]